MSMKRTIGGVALLALALAGCGASEDKPEAVTYVPTEGTVTEAGEIETRPAPAVDVEEYGEDIGALYAAIGVTDCEPGLMERDIDGALYLDCPSDAPVDIRIYGDTEAAHESALWSAETFSRAAYVYGRMVVRGDLDALAEFRETIEEEAK